MSHKLAPDQPTPPLSLPLVGGGRFELDQEAPEAFTMIVVYRGHHCPVCKSYLTQLAALRERFEDAGFSIVAVSMNDEELATQSYREWALDGLRVAYGLTPQMARDWGLWVSKAFKPSEQEIFAEPGLFWVRPDGRLYLVDIANMPWPRPDLEFLLSKAPYALANDYPARGTYDG
ncbi:redoxin domain-containing protein [Citreicella sp. C3M06]|uniref:redoxin domain-containing protein n=1 Tax=Citreicella sp. C3M06 TaxID=2841564 RepID=UPI001C09AA4C|nr:redoxin domain-containing protein [Citreicella sp. C3M06]MBU2959261.1 redoxin domain-containing protein [Citreicella sp. C3M06]